MDKNGNYQSKKTFYQKKRRTNLGIIITTIISILSLKISMKYNDFNEQPNKYNTFDKSQNYNSSKQFETSNSGSSSSWNNRYRRKGNYNNRLQQEDEYFFQEHIELMKQKSKSINSRI
jgi:hypothetical protein